MLLVQKFRMSFVQTARAPERLLPNTNQPKHRYDSHSLRGPCLRTHISIARWRYSRTMSNVNWDALSVFLCKSEHFKLIKFLVFSEKKFAVKLVCSCIRSTTKLTGERDEIYRSLCATAVCLCYGPSASRSHVNNIVLPSSHTHTHTHTHTREYWELIQLKAWAMIQPRSSRTQTHVECGCYRNTLEVQLTRFQKHCVLSWESAWWVSEVWRGEKQSGVSCSCVWRSTRPRPQEASRSYATTWVRNSLLEGSEGHIIDSFIYIFHKYYRSDLCGFF